MKPTLEQADITDHARGMLPGDCLKIIAFAGAGKTTTLKGIANAKRERGVYLAFNKSIADEAKRKLAITPCTAATMHSLAFQAVRDMIGQPLSINARTIRDSGVMERFHIPKVEGWNNYRVSLAVGRALSAFCNSADESFGLHHGQEALVDSVGDPDFIRDRGKREQAQDAIDRLGMPIFQMAEALWEHYLEKGEMSHDMYLKAMDLNEDIRHSAFSSFRYLMVDEAQDINPVQRSIITKTGLPLIAVGDPYQQIYSWRGAENALGLLEGETKYLTQSFRFGENIAEVARHILATRPDGGPKQRLVGLGGRMPKDLTGPKAAVICRTNMGMIDEALKGMRKGIAIHVDNMAGLLADVRSAQALHDGRMGDVTTQELKVFDSWADLQIEAEEGDQTLARLSTLIEEGMAPQIERLADHQARGSNDAKMMICTAHRSKGLEWPAVMLGADWRDVNALSKRYAKAEQKSAKHRTQAMEEFNALYVAATRPIVQLRGETRILFPEPDPEWAHLSANPDDVPPDYVPPDYADA